jgi:hypothetical protein
MTPLQPILPAHWSTVHLEADLQGDARGAEEPQVDRRAREGNAPGELVAWVEPRAPRNLQAVTRPGKSSRTLLIICSRENAASILRR